MSVELKVVCHCGQKYKFDVEPAGGRMPFVVNCPVCGVDGTPLANAILAQSFTAPAAMAVAAPAAVARVSSPPPLPAAAIAATATAAPPAPALAASPLMATLLQKPKTPGEFKLGLGILGALLGAAVGAGLMYGFFQLAQVRFPLMGTGIGALSGLGARLLAKGKDVRLGTIAGGIALAGTGGALYLMNGAFFGHFLITMAISAFWAYRITG
jgi:hypothetical protein